MPPLTVKYSYGDRISTFQYAEVDIIVPFYGQYQKVRDCVESILLHTTSCNYLLTVVDDGSPNETFLEQLRKAAPIQALRKDHEGFAAAVNYGFAKTRKPWVCVVHSDVKIMSKWWLQRLGESMLSKRKGNVRLVHARTNKPSLECKYLTSTLMNQMMKDIVVEEDEPLPMVCCLFHRQLVSHIGGYLLKPYPLAGYENVELYYRLKKYGFKEMVCGSSWVFHDGASTIKQLTVDEKSIMERNYDLCLQDIC